MQLGRRGAAEELVSAPVRTAEARLRYYAERFDTVEVDSPFYRLPTPETAARWAERTPEGFVFHAKASKEMTGHEETDSRERAFAQFRESLAPLEESGKLRGVLLQFHPRVKKSPEALDELSGVAELLAPLVPLIEFRHRSWMTEEERAHTLAFLEQHGLAYVSVDSPRTRASNVLPRIAAATHDVAYIRFHGRNWKTWNKKTKTSGERFDWLYSREDLEDWVDADREARRGGARGVRAVQQQPPRLRAAQRTGAARAAGRGGHRGDGRRRAGAGERYALLMRLLSLVHGPLVRAELFGDVAREDGHGLDEWSVVDERLRRRGRSRNTTPCSSSAAR